MPWAKLDDRRAMHPKLRSVGFAARGLDEAAICQSSADGSAGIISPPTLLLLGIAHNSTHKATLKLAASLVAEGRWHVAGEHRNCSQCAEDYPHVRDGWVIHNYLEYNDPELFRKRTEAGRIGGKASGEARRRARLEREATVQATVEQSGNDDRSSMSEPSRTRTRTRPDSSVDPPARRHRGSQLPDGWQPSEQLRDWAMQWPGVDLRTETAKFRDYHLAKGSVMVNWDAAWRTWITNAWQFKHPGQSRDGTTTTHREHRPYDRSERQRAEASIEAALRAGDSDLAADLRAGLEKIGAPP